jgi:lysophospholipase L1-like esterase
VRCRILIGLLGLALVAACAVVLLTRTAPPAAASGTRQCLRVTGAHDAALRSPFPGRAPGLIVVLGDSYSQGEGLPAGRDGAFPALIAQETGRPVLLDGYGSTGFTTRGYCADRPVAYGERLAPDHLLAQPPATVVVEGGVNDARHGDPSRVGAAAVALLHRLAGVPQVIVVGPAEVGTADPGRLTTVDQALAGAARAAGRPYVHLRAHPLPLQGDGLHPTAAGQQIIARLLVPLLAGTPAAADPAVRG